MDLISAASVLGLTPAEMLSITHQGLSARYRKVMKGNHPDLGGSNEQTVLINNARDFLRDWIKAGRPVAAPPPQPQPPPPPQPEPEPEPVPEPSKPRPPSYKWLTAYTAVLALVIVKVVASVGPPQKTPIAALAPAVPRPAVSTYHAPNRCVFDDMGNCASMIFDPAHEGLPPAYHRPNRCVVVNRYGRCARMAYDAWHSDPKDDELRLFSR
jgi:hypothetical protein